MLLELFNIELSNRMDVNNSKDRKESVFLAAEEAEAEKLARSPKSGCSCSPQGSPIGESQDEEKPKNSLNTLNFAGALLASKS